MTPSVCAISGWRLSSSTSQ